MKRGVSFSWRRWPWCVRRGASKLGGSVLSTLLKDALDFRVPEFEIVLKLVGAHDACDGDAILFQNEILAIQADTFDDSAEIDAGLGYGHAINHGWFGFH